MSGPDNEQNERLAALLAKCGLGDRAAFAELYEATQSKLFGIALRIVRERHVAEEVLQDCFVNIWNHAADYAVARAAPLTWMSAIVRNRSLDLLRRPAVVVQDEDDVFALLLADERPAPVDALAARRDEAQVARCMQHLQQEQHQAILLAFFNGLSHTEIAGKLGKPLGTIKTHIRRGMLKLKSCLDGHVNEGVGA